MWQLPKHPHRKINMEPKNHPIEKGNHFPNHHFQVPCLSSRVYSSKSVENDPSLIVTYDCSMQRLSASGILYSDFYGNIRWMVWMTQAGILTPKIDLQMVCVLRWWEKTFNKNKFFDTFEVVFCKLNALKEGRFFYMTFTNVFRFHFKLFSSCSFVFSKINML